MFKKKLSLVMSVFLSAGISLTSCKKQDEVRPNAGNNNNGSVHVEAVTCAYTIKATESEVDGSKLNLPPGSFVCIENGSRGPLYLKNFVGAPGKPITFINAAGGQTIIKGTSSGPWAIKVGYCKDIRITGTGSSSQYGLVFEGGNNGFTLPELTTDFEVDHVEIRNTGFAGMMAKTDPNCDSKTWRNNFTMQNVSIHDNYVHDVGGEGFYIGNSFYNGKDVSPCGTVYPHEIHNLKVYKNITKNTGCEGVQVGCATTAEVYDNYIENPGKAPFAAYQNNGLQIGAGTGGKCYNNIVKNAPGNGMIVNGIGGNLVYNNLILNSGALGIFCDERTDPKEGFTFINNTIVNSGDDGMKLYCELVPYCNVINNIIINPKTGKFINAATGVKLNDKNNYTNMDAATVKFANLTGGDYSLTSASPAVNTGADVSSYGISFDLNKNQRPYGGAYDIGAYEYGGSASTPPTDPTPVDPNPTPTGQTVASLTLVNADTDKDIMTLTNGAVINTATLGTKNFNIRANTNPSAVGSVKFGLDANAAYRTETGAPYALAGDNAGNYNVWTPTAGSHTVTATPYSAANGAGTKGTALVINFTVENGTTTPPAGGGSTPPPTDGGSTPPPTGSTLKLYPSDDVYMDGTKRLNNEYLRVTGGNKIAYVRYEVSGLGQGVKPSNAKIRLKIDSDGGTAKVNVSSGSHSNWTENDMTSTTRPAIASKLSSINGTFVGGSIYEFDVTPAITGDGVYTLIITMDPAAEGVAFSSKEGIFRPELQIAK